MPTPPSLSRRLAWNRQALCRHGLSPRLTAVTARALATSRRGGAPGCRCRDSATHSRRTTSAARSRGSALARSRRGVGRTAWLSHHVAASTCLLQLSPRRMVRGRASPPRPAYSKVAGRGPADLPWRSPGRAPGRCGHGSRSPLPRAGVPHAGRGGGSPHLPPESDRPSLRAVAASCRGSRARRRPDLLRPGRSCVGARVAGRQPRRRDPGVPRQPQAEDRRRPGRQPRHRDREGAVSDQGGRRGAPERGQDGQAGRETGPGRGEVPARHLLAAGRPGSARTHRARPRPGHLHAAGALAASGSAHPRHRVRAYRHDHQGHGRGRPANQPLPDDADADQRDVRPGRGARHAGDRPALCVPLGLPGRGAPVHPVRRALGGRRPRFAGRARRVRRMAPAASDRGAVRRAGAVHEPRAGDVLLQPERGRVPGGPPARGGVLDVDLGSGGTGAGDAADGVPPGHGEVRARSRGGDDPAVGRAGDGSGPKLLPAPGGA